MTVDDQGHDVGGALDAGGVGLDEQGIPAQCGDLVNHFLTGVLASWGESHLLALAGEQ
ncbi:hypothetical protein AB0K88_22610 [Streptomyces werraensis]|uniref:hypothetical protein n=1 Tax=Streptomyces werraensis TaxID=68284 RepID=UPI0034179C69